MKYLCSQKNIKVLIEPHSIEYETVDDGLRQILQSETAAKIVPELSSDVKLMDTNATFVKRFGEMMEPNGGSFKPKQPIFKSNIIHYMMQPMQRDWMKSVFEGQSWWKNYKRKTFTILDLQFLI